VVGPRTTIDLAHAAVEAEGTRWAVVVNDEGALLVGSSRPGRPTVPASPTALLRVRYMRRSGRAWALRPRSDRFAEMLQNDAAWVAVLDNGLYLGVLTPDTLHAALRRSVGGEPVRV